MKEEEKKMEGKFEAQAREIDQEKGVYRVKISYTGPGSFNGQEVVRVISRPNRNYDVRSDLYIANLGLESISPDKGFEDLGAFLDAACAEGQNIDSARIIKEHVPRILKAIDEW